MKTKLLLGALMVSAMLCGRSQGADLIGRMVSLDEGCAACAKPACEPACEPACDVCAPRHRCDLFAGLKDLFACRRCAPACEVPACEPAKCVTPEPACEPACGCAKCRPQPVRALVRKIASVGECNACCPVACEPACEKPACEPACKPACEPACKPACEPACDPACEAACEPCCQPKRPVLNFLRNLLGCDRDCCAVSECGCGVEAAPADKGGKSAPAPLPAAPSPNA